MRVLISGAEGFIGKHTVTRMKEAGHEICGYDLLNGVDILDARQLDDTFTQFKPDVVIHLAAQVFLGASLKDPQLDALINIIGTINILEAARRHNVPVVLSSSGAVYGTNDRSNVKESHVPEPMSPYGVSKRSAEMYALLYNDLYGMQNVIFRFSSVYGKGRKKTSINLILDKVLKGETVKVTGDGNQTRDFTHVSDVVEALLLAIEGKFLAGVYNIGTGHSTSINNLLQLITKIVGKEVAVEYSSKSKGDPLRNDFNVNLATEHGFKTKISLEDGLRKLAAEI